MFSIIISEKGGAERREVYDRTEINVGRVQGNDLMLPKGNVSKRHARLLFRDGRFIVTDLKSTNGTYVNGRKIAQATIVREGDKIYIGDFVLRIETSGSDGAAASPSAAAPAVAQAAVAPPPLPGAAPAASAAVAAPGAAAPVAGTTDPPRPAPPIDAADSSASQPSSGPQGKPGSQEGVNHFPLERDPDESVPQYQVPGPPRVPAGTRTPSKPPPAASTPAPPPAVHMTAPAPPPRVESAPQPQPVAVVESAPVPSPAPSAIPISSNRKAQSSDDRLSVDAAQMASHRAALMALVTQVSESVNLTPIQDGQAVPAPLATQIEQALKQRAATMKSSGEVPADVEADALVSEASREILGLGPVGPLLDDEDVTEVQVVRHDYVVAMKGRHRPVPSEVAFSNEQTLGRLIRRLCVESGKPLGPEELHVQRRLPTGVRMFAVLPPASDQAHMLVLRKPQRADFMLDDLVRSGTISRAIATLLSQCVSARANLLVTGAQGAGSTSLLGALASAGGTDDRVMVLQEDDEIIFNQPHTVSLLMGDTDDDGARAVRSAVRVRPDRLVVGSFAGHVAAEVVDAIGDGVTGVLAASHAPTLRQLAARLPADLAATRPGVPVDTAREWLGTAFDLVLEIARLRDGRHRVMRVSEFTPEPGKLSVRDIFTFNVERTATGGSVEGSFLPSGVVPRVVEDLALRGASVDTSIFKRGSNPRA